MQEAPPPEHENRRGRSEHWIQLLDVGMQQAVDALGRRGQLTNPDTRGVVDRQGNSRNDGDHYHFANTSHPEGTGSLRILQDDVLVLGHILDGRDDIRREVLRAHLPLGDQRVLEQGEPLALRNAAVDLPLDLLQVDCASCIQSCRDLEQVGLASQGIDFDQRRLGGEAVDPVWQPGSSGDLPVGGRPHEVALTAQRRFLRKLLSQFLVRPKARRRRHTAVLRLTDRVRSRVILRIQRAGYLDNELMERFCDGVRGCVHRAGSGGGTRVDRAFGLTRDNADPCRVDVQQACSHLCETGMCALTIFYETNTQREVAVPVEIDVRTAIIGNSDPKSGSLRSKRQGYSTPEPWPVCLLVLLAVLPQVRFLDGVQDQVHRNTCAQGMADRGNLALVQDVLPSYRDWIQSQLLRRLVHVGFQRKQNLRYTKTTERATDAVVGEHRPALMACVGDAVQGGGM